MKLVKKRESALVFIKTVIFSSSWEKDVKISGILREMTIDNIYVIINYDKEKHSLGITEVVYKLWWAVSL